MELEQFIEQDIITFLDEKLHSTDSAVKQKSVAPIIAPEDVGLYSPTRDYQAELAEAIRDVNRARAQRILSDLKQEYDSFPPDAPERLERQRLLERLYRRFQEAFSSQGSLPAASASRQQDTVSPAVFTPPAPESSSPVTKTQSLVQTPSSVPSTRDSSPPLPTTSSPPAPQILTPQTPALGTVTPDTPTPDTPTPDASSLISPRLPPKGTASPLPTAMVSDALHHENEKPAKNEKLTIMENSEFELEFAAEIERIRTLVAERSLTKAISQYQELKRRLTIEQLPPDRRAAVLRQLKELYAEINGSLTANGSAAPECAEQLELVERAVARGDLGEAMRHFNEAKRACARPEERERLKALYHRIQGLEAGSTGLLDEAERMLTGTP